jgi:Beta/Gamma crystallin
MAHVILFENAQFHGQHKHVFRGEPNLNAGDDNYFNDKVSSLVVLEGNWAFYADWKFQSQYPPILGPGLYPVLPAGIKNDDMSSLQPVDAGPTVSGGPVDSHVMLFEHANFHGAHKHVFTREPNLNADDDSYFNDKISSFVILSGLWVFFSDWQFKNPYAGGTQFGPAIDGSWVEALGIKNDDMSSLQPVPVNLVAKSRTT